MYTDACAHLHSKSRLLLVWTPLGNTVFWLARCLHIRKRLGQRLYPQCYLPAFKFITAGYLTLRIRNGRYKAFWRHVSPPYSSSNNLILETSPFFYFDLFHHTGSNHSLEVGVAWTEDWAHPTCLFFLTFGVIVVATSLTSPYRHHVSHIPLPSPHLSHPPTVSFLCLSVIKWV